MLEDHAWFSEFGVPFDLRSLPKKHFQAHMAILEGKSERRSEQQEKSEREAKKARRKSKRGR